MASSPSRSAVRPRATRYLQIAPDIGMTAQVETAWEIQRSGLAIYPLTGQVTERQIAEQCQAANGYDGILWLTHGGPLGVMLRRNTLTANGGEPEQWLPAATVAAYAKAADVQLVVLASCEGRQLAREIHFRSGALVIYSEGELMSDTAYTLMATFLRQLRDRPVADALALADTLGMSYFPQQHPAASPGGAAASSQEAASADYLQNFAAVMSERMDKIEASMNENNSAIAHLNQRTLKTSGMRRALWVVGIILLLAPFVLAEVLLLMDSPVDLIEFLPSLLAAVIVGILLLMYGGGMITFRD